MSITTVALLFGGKSSEYEISCRSAATILASLAEAGYHVLPIGITRTGVHCLFSGEPARIRDATWETEGTLRPVWVSPYGGYRTDAGEPLPIDIILPALHGRYGEDGCIQGFLDTLGIPYVGCGVEASALAWDKVRAKECAERIGVPTLPWVETRRENAASAMLSALSLPLFIKPVLSGSSVGAGRADSPEALCAVLDAAAQAGDRLMAEPCFPGRELEVAILDDGETVVSRVGEIITDGFYDYETKYHTNTATLAVPADIPDAMAKTIRGYALEVFRALGCRHLARVDFFADEEHIYFNEINTLPGFTSVSMYPRLMADSGIPLPTLVSRLVEAAR